MKAMYSKIVFVVLAAAFISSCSTTHKGISSNYSYDTECIDAEINGMQELKAYGKGNSKREVLQSAMKQALEDVCFNGIRKGSPDCELAPLVSDANTKVEHEKYYSKLFTKKRKYSDYVKVVDKSALPKRFKSDTHGKSKLVYGIVVQVDRADLKQKLTRKDIVGKHKKRKDY